MTHDHKPPSPPTLISIAAALAREGRGAEAQAVRDAAEELTRIKQAMNNLRSYVAVEGYSDNEGSRVVGLAYEGSIWGPCCHPETQPYELAEAIEQWLHGKIDAAKGPTA